MGDGWNSAVHGLGLYLELLLKRDTVTFVYLTVTISKGWQSQFDKSARAKASVPENQKFDQNKTSDGKIMTVCATNETAQDNIDRPTLKSGKPNGHNHKGNYMSNKY